MDLIQQKFKEPESEDQLIQALKLSNKEEKIPTLVSNDIKKPEEKVFH